MNTHLKTAYDLGAATAQHAFKHAEEGLDPNMMGAEAPPEMPPLGDPNFWQGGTPSPEEAAAAVPDTPEEVVNLLPAGTFQGLQMKITPDGQKSTTVKVTPDALSTPDSLASLFQASPGTKVEMEAPEGGDMPVEGGAMPPPEGAVPPPAGAVGG